MYIKQNTVENPVIETGTGKISAAVVKNITETN